MSLNVLPNMFPIISDIFRWHFAKDLVCVLDAI